MEPIAVIGIAAALIAGAVIGWCISQFRARSELQAFQTTAALLQDRVAQREEALAESESTLDQLQAEYLSLRTNLSSLETRLDEERKSAAEKLALLQNVRENFQDSFKALSSDALKSNNQAFLELATANLSKFQEGAKGELEKRENAVNELVKPLKESLQKVDLKIEAMESSRSTAFAAIGEQLKMLSETQHNLRSETSNLVKALRTPHVRGRWGEIQLRRVVEMAGMLEYCDFVTQDSVTTEEGRLRPDLVVKLPNGRSIVVDSKVPIQAYLDSLNATEDSLRLTLIADHARHVRTHLQQLSSKSYWEQYSGADFVVLFIPGETFYQAALEQDPTLIEHGAERKVLIATPTSLIALLKVIAFGWRQDQVEQQAKEISELGSLLYDRIRSMAAHLEDLRKHLDRAVDSYNRSIGSFESRVFVAARKFKELGAGTGEDIPDAAKIEKSTRGLNIELIQGKPPGEILSTEVTAISVTTISEKPDAS